MKKVLISLLLLSSLSFAICTTAPNGDIICTGEDNPTQPIIIFH